VIRKRRIFPWPVVAVLAALFLAFIVSSAAAKVAGSERTTDRSATYNTGGFTFGKTQQLLQTGPLPLTGFSLEPEIKTDLFNNLYVTAMEGVPGGVDLWKSTDLGTSFDYLGQPDGAQCPVPSNCVNGVGLGGGDDSIDVSNGGYLYVSSLWAGSTTVSVSMDGGTGGVLPGQKWEVNPIAGQPPALDRQWIAAYGPRTLYQSYTEIATGTVFVEKSVDAGKTFGVPVPLYPIIGTTIESFRMGNLVVDQYNGNIYLAFVADATFGHTRAEVWLGKSTNGGASWSLTKAYQGPAGTNAAHSFPITAVDRGGNVHISFARCDVSGDDRSNCQIWLVSSGDAGATWLDAVRVSNGPDTQGAVFPWIVAGSPGVVDVTWYGSSNPDPDANSNNNWHVFFAQTRDALTNMPTFNQVQHPQLMHDTSICFRGLDCDLGTPGNRDLAEYYSMTIDPDGNANIAFSDSVTNCPSATCIVTTWYTKQTSGDSAYEPPPGTPPPPATFAANKQADPAHTGAEPNIWIDSDNCIYLAAIGSDAPGGLPVYKSNDMGFSFSLKPVSGPLLVGDADIITFPDGNPTLNDDVYLSSLELADVRIMKSANGESFAQVPAPGNVSNPSSDRMWFAVDKFGTDQVLYQNDHELVTEDIRVFKSVNDGAWTGTSAITDPELLLRTTPNTNTGNIWVDKTNHNVYATWPGSTNTTNALEPPFGKQLEVWVAVSSGNTTAANAGGLGTWTDYPVLMSVLDSPIAPAPPAGAETFGVKAGNIFSVGDIDSAGNLYVTWAMNSSRTNQFQIWFSSSRDQGKTWYGPHLVSQGIGTSVMPWIAAGDNGRVSIAWFGTSTIGDANTVPLATQWNVYFAQSLNAASREPVFTQVQASDHVIHVGQISTGGTFGSSDRSLLDFFEIALDRGGFTHMVFADNGPTSPASPPDAALTYTKQTGGPRAYTSPTFPSCPGGATAAGLASFRAAYSGTQGVRVIWQTATELQTAGFNVWRSAGKSYRKVNAKLIPSQSSFGVGGHKYEYLDRGALARGAYSYKLELVKLDGSRRWAGPVRAVAPARSGTR
jgi:hypothetical protein